MIESLLQLIFHPGAQISRAGRQDLDLRGKAAEPRQISPDVLDMHFAGAVLMKDYSTALFLDFLAGFFTGLCIATQTQADVPLPADGWHFLRNGRLPGGRFHLHHLVHKKGLRPAASPAGNTGHAASAPAASRAS